MKKVILLLSLVLATTLAHSNQERSSVNTGVISTDKELQEERPSDSKGNPNDDYIQREEDINITTPDGREVKNDDSVLGNDKVKVDD